MDGSAGVARAIRTHDAPLWVGQHLTTADGFIHTYASYVRNIRRNNHNEAQPGTLHAKKALIAFLIKIVCPFFLPYFLGIVMAPSKHYYQPPAQIQEQTWGPSHSVVPTTVYFQSKCFHVESYKLADIIFITFESKERLLHSTAYFQQQQAR